MKKQSILASIAKEKKYEDCCNRIANDQYKGDLFNHLYLIFADMPAKKIEAIYSTGGFMAYYSVTAYRNYNSYHSSFYKVHRHIGFNTTELFDTPNPEDDKRPCLDLLEEVMNDFDPNDKNERDDVFLFQKYQELGTYRKVAKEIGMPWTTVAGNIQRYKKKIRERFEKAVNLQG